MTVAELIEKLKQYPPDLEVFDMDREGSGFFVPVEVVQGYVNTESGWAVPTMRSNPVVRQVLHIG
jgi:hypothetical protein